MSPALRLLLAPAAALAGALGCYMLPQRARRRGFAVALASVAACSALLVSAVGGVGGGGVVSREFPAVVRGVPLGVRGDSTGVVLALLAAAAALISLWGRERRPLERTGLLLCLAGSCGACLGANVFLLVVGLELGNVGALLLAVAATRDRALLRRAKAAFGIQHVASLGLLAAGLQLTTSAGTTGFGALPPGSLGVAVAAPWALAGASRLFAPAALPAGAADRVSSAWVAVAAVPSGLVVLLRLGDAAGDGGLPTSVTLMLGAAGLLAAFGGAAMALRHRARPPAAGRALLAALGGQAAVALAVGAPAARTAAVALGVALAACALSAPAWERSGDSVRRGAAALALLAAGGLPVGAATTGLVAAVGSAAAPGLPRSLLAIATGASAAAAALAACVAARRLMVAPRGASLAGRGGAAWVVGPDVVAALAAGAVLGFLPGVLLGGVADRVADARGAITVIDAGSVRGPGFGWAGGYLEVGAILMAAAWAAAGSLRRAAHAVDPPRAGPHGLARPREGAAQAAHGLARAREGAEPLLSPPGALRRLADGLGAIDGWLVTQPDLPVLILLGAAALAVNSVHR